LPSRPPVKADPWLHLMDGMVTDNFGLVPILEMIHAAIKEDGPAAGRSRFEAEFQNKEHACIIITIDTSPAMVDPVRFQDEARVGWKDYLFDRNLADAVDYVLLRQREQLFSYVGLSVQQVSEGAHLSRFAALPNAPPPRNQIQCDFWDIALRDVRMPDRPEPPWLPTEWDITAEQQDYLARAACLAMRNEWNGTVRTWFGSSKDVNC